MRRASQLRGAPSHTLLVADQQSLHDRFMGEVFVHAVASLDGFIADPDDEVGPLFEWYGNGDEDIAAGAPFKVSAASAPYVRGMWRRIGTTIMGRHLFDLTNGWDASPPAGEHIVVVSHRPRPKGWHPESPTPFIPGVAEAVRVAKELAGDRDVCITAGDIAGQALDSVSSTSWRSTSSR